MQDLNTAQLEDNQRACLASLLDILIPALESKGMLAAGALGIAGFVEARMQDTQGFSAIVLDVLSRIEALLSNAGVGALADIAPAERVALVRNVEAQQPLAFLTFLTQVYLGYYTHPSIPPKFGLPDRPPQPLGHKLPEDENLEELLAPVRGRGPLFRPC